MPWSTIKLNDGSSIPNLAFGTWKLGNDSIGVGRVNQALSQGIDHLDTAQSYGNENETGEAIRQSGLDRSQIYVTTKYSGMLSIREACQESLRKLRVSYINLYLFHTPSRSFPDIPTAWREMEKLQADGLVKSIGVSNYEIHDLELLFKTANIVPAVNQIQFHPYVYKETIPLLEYCSKRNIVIEAYSPLRPLTQHPGGSLDKTLAKIAKRQHATTAQVLLAWGRAKGTVVITSSRQKDRIRGYVEAGDIKLTSADIADIDAAGASGP